MAAIHLLPRLASAALLWYVRRFPWQRGKWRLMLGARSFLVVEVERGVFMRISELTYVEQEIVWKGLFEPETVQVFAALLTPGMTVLDLGANVGQYTLIAARRVGSQGRVHAFEPTPHVAAKLRRNIALNGLANVVINEAAVSDQSGETTLYFEEDAGENSILSNGVSTPSVKVPTVTLDEHVCRHGLTRVDVMKVDIEGAELMALRGGRALLSQDNAPLLILEVNPKTLAFSGSSVEELYGLLGEYGYRYYPIATYGLRTPIPWTNGIAAKPCHRESLRVLRETGLLSAPE